MPTYHIYRLKEEQRQKFQWAPHASGASTVHPRDYERGDSVDAPNVYAVWAGLKDAERPLKIGDLLESGDGHLYICKYVGFEEARWAEPETASAPISRSG